MKADTIKVKITKCLGVAQWPTDCAESQSVRLADRCTPYVYLQDGREQVSGHTHAHTHTLAHTLYTTKDQVGI